MPSTSGYSYQPYQARNIVPQPLPSYDQRTTSQRMGCRPAWRPDTSIENLNHSE